MYGFGNDERVLLMQHCVVHMESGPSFVMVNNFDFKLPVCLLARENQSDLKYCRTCRMVSSTGVVLAGPWAGTVRIHCAHVSVSSSLLMVVLFSTHGTRIIVELVM